MARTGDGGRHWSQRRRIFRSAAVGFIPFNNGAVVVHGGTIVVPFELTNPNRSTPDRVMAVRSRDGGRTWARAVELDSVPGLFPGTRGPQSLHSPKTMAAV